VSGLIVASVTIQFVTIQFVTIQFVTINAGAVEATMARCRTPRSFILVAGTPAAVVG
jgi:hypothetical protein